MRGVRLTGGRRAVLVEDEFELSEPHEIKWAMTTRAQIALDGAEATLSLDGKTLQAFALAPAGAVFSVESAEQEPPQAENVGVSRLVVSVAAAEGRTTVAVHLWPMWDDGAVETADIVPLADWLK